MLTKEQFEEYKKLKSEVESEAIRIAKRIKFETDEYFEGSLDSIEIDGDTTCVTVGSYDDRESCYFNNDWYFLSVEETEESLKALKIRKVEEEKARLEKNKKDELFQKNLQFERLKKELGK